MSQQINLYNPLFLTQKRYFSAHKMLVALALLVAGLGAIYGYAYWQLTYWRSEVARSSAIVEAERQRVEELRAAVERRKNLPGLEEEIRRAEENIARRQALVQLIERELAQGSTGISRYLTALARQHRDGLWLTEGEFAGQAIMLKGKMVHREALPVYLERLRQEEPFRGLSMIQVEMAAEQQTKEHSPSYFDFLLRTQVK